MSVDVSEPQDDRSQTRKDEERAIRRPPASPRSNKRGNARSVLSPVRSAVSKNPPWKRRSLRPPKRDVPQSARDVTAESSAPRRSKRILDLGGNKPRRDKESTPLRPSHSQKVFKTAKNAPKGKLSAAINANPKPTARSRHRKPMQQFTSLAMKTRSGREIKRPDWFCPR